jgi:hypothetical protein
MKGNLLFKDRVIIHMQKKSLYFYEWPSENTESKGKQTNAPGSEGNKGKGR